MPGSCLLAEFRVPEEVPQGTELMAEPNARLIDLYQLACLPAVVRLEEGQIVRLVLVNPSRVKRRVPSGTTVATLSWVAPVEEVPPIGAKAEAHLSRQQKLEKIIGELRFSEMSAEVSVKAKLALLVEKYLDAFPNTIRM